MKSTLIIIASLLFVVWGLLFWGLDAKGPVHLLLTVAALIVLIMLVFNKQLTNK